MTEIPQKILLDMLGWAKIQVYDDSRYTLVLPRYKHLSGIMDECGGRNLDVSVEDIATALGKAAIERLVVLRAENTKGPGKPVRGVPENLQRFYTKTTPEPPAALIEAQIRSTPYEQLERICAANNVSYLKQAPNQGVLVMRARNALYAALRAGKEIKMS
jgi:hypothetical protein